MINFSKILQLKIILLFFLLIHIISCGYQFIDESIVLKPPIITINSDDYKLTINADLKKNYIITTKLQRHIKYKKVIKRKKDIFHKTYEYDPSAEIIDIPCIFPIAVILFLFTHDEKIFKDLFISINPFYNASPPFYCWFFEKNKFNKKDSRCSKKIKSKKIKSASLPDNIEFENKINYAQEGVIIFSFNNGEPVQRKIEDHGITQIHLLDLVNKPFNSLPKFIQIEAIVNNSIKIRKEVILDDSLSKKVIRTPYFLSSVFNDSPINAAKSIKSLSDLGFKNYTQKLELKAMNRFIKYPLKLQQFEIELNPNSPTWFKMNTNTLHNEFIDSNSQPNSTNHKLEIPQIDFGDYHALLIGNNKYLNISNLQTPLNDINKISNLLEKLYGFKTKIIRNGTRKDILYEFDKLRENLSIRDNLLIYYAGHGYYDEDIERGYWLPINANKNTTANWISNTEIIDKLKAIKSNHVLVIADSCFSGSLTRSINVQSMTNSKYLKRIFFKKSRTVLTSGGIEPVMDNGGGNHSVFANLFMKALRENIGIIDATQLFINIRNIVIANSPQTPQYSDIKYAGHEGGDFIFVRY